MGTKKTVDKNRFEISTYLNENNILRFDYSFQFNEEMLDSFSTLKYSLDTVKFQRQITQSEIQIRIFDSLGRFVNGHCQCYGNFKRLNILKTKDLTFFSQLPNNKSLNFSNEFNLWKINPCDREEIRKNTLSKKYTMVVYWNIWSNHFSKVMLKEVEKYRKKFDPTGSNTLIILVNTDRDLKK